MTQRVFDVNNEQDMKDLWDILPEYYEKITKDCMYNLYKKYGGIDAYDSFGIFFKINWHDKTEITRPIQEATEADIGKLCRFWNSDGGLIYYGILQSIGSETFRLQNKYPYSECYHHCRRLTADEVKELC